MEKYFYELFQPKLPRLGPGTRKATHHAFNKLGLADKNINILDVGCGNGAQTLDLAEIITGHITASDFNSQFLDELKLRAEEKGYSDKITFIQADMNNLSFPENEFDVIWCEGAIYITGIENALTKWKKFLKPAGFIVASDLCWLTDERPKEINEYMDSIIQGTMTVQEYLATIEQHGYKPVDHFVLPEEAWILEYYTPLINELAVFDKKYAGNEEAGQVSLMMKKRN